jgi:hypothetical protein
MLARASARNALLAITFQAGRIGEPSFSIMVNQ